MRRKLAARFGLVAGPAQDSLSLKSKGMTRVGPDSCKVCESSPNDTGEIVPAPSGFAAFVYSKNWVFRVKLSKSSAMIYHPPKRNAACLIVARMRRIYDERCLILNQALDAELSQFIHRAIADEFTDEAFNFQIGFDMEMIQQGGELNESHFHCCETGG
jgi:hypothetical protein